MRIILRGQILLCAFILLAPLEPLAIKGGALVSAAGPQPESSPHGLELSGSVSRAFGETLYEMKALTPDPRGTGALIPIRSRLEFPLDAALLGLQIAYRPPRGRFAGWEASLELQKDLADGSNEMTDRDYFDRRPIFYGASDPSQDLLLLDLRILRKVTESGATSLELLLDLNYEKLAQEIVGFRGWQGSLYSDTRVEIHETAPALDYEVEYFSPRLGARLDQGLGSRHLLGGELALGPLFARDHDDHLLRNRRAEGSAWGLALVSEVSLARRLGSRLALRAAAGFRYYYSEGEVDQRFYAGGDTRDEILDLPYLIESRLFRVGLALDCGW